jgi:methyl coenzyme M reductase subunit C
MRELPEMLRAREFIVFIFSGGGRDCMRPVSEQMYGIPRERVIGSSTTVQYRDAGMIVSAP